MADQNITALPVSTTPASSDQLLLVGATEEKLIDYDKLADAILQKLTSKQYTLDQGTKTLPAALNELNSNTNRIYEDLGRFVSVSADVNTIFDAMNDESISIKRYSGESANTPESGSGIIITFKDVLSFGWNIAICNGKVYSRNIVNGNNGNWVLLS